MRFVSAVIVLVLFCPIVNAAKDDKDRARAARESFEEGLELYGCRRYSEAIDAFREAYALRPSYKILYNIAQTEVVLSHPDLALEAFEAYLVEGGDQITLSRREKVKAEMEHLREEVGEVEIDGPRGLEIWIDGERRGRLPLAGSLRLSSGEHFLVLRSKGGAKCELTITVVGGRRTREQCREQEMVIAPFSDVMLGNSVFEEMPLEGRREGAEAPGATYKRAGPWVAAGLGVAALVAASVCAGKARSLNTTLDARCPNGACPERYRDEVEALPRYAGAADGLFISTAAIAAVVAILFAAPWKDRADHTDHIAEAVTTARSDPAEGEP